MAFRTMMKGGEQLGEQEYLKWGVQTHCPTKPLWTQRKPGPVLALEKTTLSSSPGAHFKLWYRKRGGGLQHLVTFHWFR